MACEIVAVLNPVICNKCHVCDEWNERLILIFAEIPCLSRSSRKSNLIPCGVCEVHELVLEWEIRSNVVLFRSSINYIRNGMNHACVCRLIFRRFLLKFILNFISIRYGIVDVDVAVDNFCLSFHVCRSIICHWNGCRSNGARRVLCCAASADGIRNQANTFGGNENGTSAHSNVCKSNSERVTEKWREKEKQIFHKNDENESRQQFILCLSTNLRSLFADFDQTVTAVYRTTYAIHTHTRCWIDATTTSISIYNERRAHICQQQQNRWLVLCVSIWLC